MLSSTAAQVSDPAEDDPAEVREHRRRPAAARARGACTMPRLTALSATIANAIVIETDGSVGARLVGTPLQHGEREAGDDEAADQPADRLGAG